MNFPRASGILLHPTSLPGRFGIGDLGPEAYRFVDFLANAGQTFWQILPLGPTGYGNSPYSSYSAFAGNTLLISPEILVEAGLLRNNDLDSKPTFQATKVDYGMVSEWKNKVLVKAFENFQAAGGCDLYSEYEMFSLENSWWLSDYAIFRAIKSSHSNLPWNQWPLPLRSRDSAEIDSARSRLSQEEQAEQFFQFLFFRQWNELKRYSAKNGVSIIGDIPIFVALDSADVWCNQQIFKLNAGGSPKVVAGVPPDYFSKTGQLWGVPVYNWDAMRADNFGWWIARVAFTLQMVDVVRLDHFIGFTRNWEVPGGESTAENGNWVDVPGREFLAVLHQRLGNLPIIAEDLGSMTPEAESLRDKCGFPGMRILQYAFGGDADNCDLPHNYVRNCLAYTGTHDNDTCVGWYKSTAKTVRVHCRKYLMSSSREIHWNMIRAVQASVANTAIVPAQDILGLGTDARMNTPARANGNWEWRLGDGDLHDGIAEKLREITETCGRTNHSAKNRGKMP